MHIKHALPLLLIRARASVMLKQAGLYTLSHCCHLVINRLYIPYEPYVPSKN